MLLRDNIFVLFIFLFYFYFILSNQPNFFITNNISAFYSYFLISFIFILLLSTPLYFNFFKLFLPYLFSS